MRTSNECKNKIEEYADTQSQSHGKAKKNEVYRLRGMFHVKNDVSCCFDCSASDICFIYFIFKNSKCTFKTLLLIF